MNTISWLMIGHLIGDWMFQNDWMAKGKRTGFFAIPGLVHFVVYTAITLGFLIVASAGKLPVWIYALVGVVLFITHWILDATDIVDVWINFYKQTANSTVRLMVDQTMHMVILALIAVAVSGG